MSNDRMVLVSEDGKEFDIEPIDQTIFKNPVSVELRRIAIGQKLRIVLSNPTRVIDMDVTDIRDRED